LRFEPFLVMFEDNMATALIYLQRSCVITRKRLKTEEKRPYIDY